ncbi:hypothetical protein BGZ82_008778 [Podila clonocystis]|nr:hypothetical protein BGZ82_008778 [Podila clonocystis]
MDQQHTNTSRDDPLATLMHQLQSMSLDVLGLNTGGERTDTVLQEQASNFRLEWDNFFASGSARAQEDGVPVVQYVSISLAYQLSKFLQERSVAGDAWMDTHPGTEGWELFHANRFRQVDDLFLIWKVLEADGADGAPCGISLEKPMLCRKSVLDLCDA